ncbi:MAG: Toxin translocation ATP-binding protein [Pseudomonadota bacterium]
MTQSHLNPAADLAELLSRLAALQGHAVPLHRFTMLETTADGVELASLGPALRARELWLARFPQAEVEQGDADRLERGHFPALWCEAQGERVLLLRGLQGAGALLAEDAQGQRVELTREQAAQGQVLRLGVTAAAPGEAGHGSRSASEWFAWVLRRHRRVFAEAVLATLVVSVIGLVTSLYSMQVYDRVVPTKGLSTLWVLTVGALVAIGLELLLKHVRTHSVDRACKAIDMELSSVFFGKALDIRMDARPRTVGSFANQIRYFESVRNFLTSSTLFILADAPFALLFVGVIALIAGPVALVPLLMVPIALLAGLAFRQPIERLSNANMAESNRKNGLLIEAIDGIESIKAASGEWKMLDRWRALTATMADSELRLRGLTSLSSHMSQTIQQLSYVGLVVAGVLAIVEGHLTMGGLIACTIISGRALGPLAQIPSLVVQWKQARIALQALDGIMAMPGDREPGRRLLVPTQCRGELRLDKVEFSYMKELPALQLPQLAFKPGERVALIGAVGSGKTTLVKLLSGLFKPAAGTAFLDDIDITHLAPEFVREHVGYLPQDVRLFQGTLRDNLTLGLPAPSDSELLRAAALTGLDQVIQAHPKGLELEITEGGKGLSGGQRQLVGLTRLLLARPRVMLLDEPTASMDAQLEAKVMQHLFQEVSPDSLLVVVTHKMAILPLVNRVIVLDRGRVVLDGPRDAVLARLRSGATQQAKPAAAVQPVAPTPLPMATEQVD